MDTQITKPNIILVKGGINIEMANVLPGELKKLQKYFTQLINLQIHRFRNGKMILHFDNDGTLRKIDVEKTIWGK